MDEIIVRLARAIASMPRLRILSLLARREEMTPTKLAEELRLPLNVLSLHLRSLTTAGLIARRKSGAWCHYRAESPYDETTPSGQLATWLKSRLGAALGRGENPGLHEVRDSSDSPESSLHRTIFEAATAFTDLRRLQILRHLARQRAAVAHQLEDALSMSPQALSRHMAKLIRRGYVQTGRAGRDVVYDLSPAAKTAIHKRMFEIVRATWQKKQSRTS
jgi:DNA-binding transcriptional ArsR family regulator